MQNLCLYGFFPLLLAVSSMDANTSTMIGPEPSISHAENQQSSPVELTEDPLVALNSGFVNQNGSSTSIQYSKSDGVESNVKRIDYYAPAGIGYPSYGASYYPPNNGTSYDSTYGYSYQNVNNPYPVMDDYCSSYEGQFCEVYDPYAFQPNAYAPCDVRGSVFVFGEYLYWNAKEEGLEYTEYASFGLIPPLAPSLNIVSLDSGTFHSGSRVGFGYRFPSCSPQWDFQAKWTWFYSDAHDVAPTDNVVGLTTYQIPLLLNPASDPVLLQAIPGSDSEASWTLHHNVFDLEFGYACYLDASQSFYFRPHAGLRGARIFQDFDVDYFNVTFLEEPGTFSDFSSFNENNFWGVGLHFGTDLLWNFFKGFSIYGKGGGSLLWGHFDVTQTTILETPVVIDGILFPAGTQRNRDSSSHHQIVSSLDLGAGLIWRRCFCSLSEILISVGWEFHIWFSQNQLHHVVDAAENYRFVNLKGDLSLQGLVARLALTF